MRVVNRMFPRRSARMKIKLPAIHIICAAALLGLVIVSCANPFVDRAVTKADNSSSGYGVLSLTLSGVASAPAARTILPGASDLAMSTYEVVLSRTGLADKTATFTSPTVAGDITGLDPGEWTITANGKTAGGVTIASGTATVTVALPGPTAATVNLDYTTADASNSGSIDIILLFPKSVGITGVEATLDGDAINPALTVADNDDTNNMVVCTLSDITRASPLLRIQLKKGSATMLYWAERVWVYKNITTTNVSTIASTDFGLAPPAPESLTAALQADGSVSISWPNVETANTYAIERSVDGGTSYTVLSDAIAAGTTTYTDDTTTLGTTCTYRVSASNPFGTSEYASAAGSLLIVSDAGFVATDKDALAITFGSGDSASGVIQNVSLPISGLNGSTIAWAETLDVGGNIAISGTAGAITRPAFPLTENATVTVRATITNGTASDTKDFTLVILAPAGTVTDPYEIHTLAQLVAMRNNVIGVVSGANAKVYKLMADIDLASINTGIGWVPIGNASYKFTGTFDGNNKTISNLFINESTADHKGLFGYTSNATITDLSLRSIAVTGKAMTGGLVGYCEYGSSIITNCSVTGTVSGSGYAVGGLAGYARAVITNCNTAVTVNVTVSTATSAGGLVGNAHYATITNCYATGNVLSSGYYVGGLVGSNDSTISKSYATGTVTGLDDVGGLIGYQESYSLSDCYATGAVHTTGTIGWWGYTGGLVGYGSDTSITSCFASGAVTSLKVGVGKGGIVGSVSGTTTVTNCFYDTNTTGMTAANEAHGTAKTTAEMKLQATFTGWDFTNVWNIGGGAVYLRAFPEPIIITFDSKGGSEVASQIVASGSLVMEPAVPTNPNYTFNAWYKEPECTILWLFSSGTVSSSMTLYADWIQDSNK